MELSPPSWLWESKKLEEFSKVADPEAFSLLAPDLEPLLPVIRYVFFSFTPRPSVFNIPCSIGYPYRGNSVANALSLSRSAVSVPRPGG